MQIIIDIPDEDYYRIKYMPDAYKDREPRIYTTIRNGIPLPKHHGRLIDYDDLIEKLDRYGRENVKYQLPYSPTIIEADKAKSEEEKW